jgi:hypothetical protein
MFVQAWVRKFAPAALSLFHRRSVGDCEVVVLALEVARKAVVEHGELRIIATESMIIIWGPGPIRGNLP